MLLRQNAGRGHHHPLPARFNCDQQGHESNQGFSGAHIALQQPVHALGRGHVGGDFLDRPGLGVGGLIRQRLQNTRLQAAGCVAFDAPGLPLSLPRQRQGQLMRKQLIIGQTRPGRRQRAQVIQALRRVCGLQRVMPGRPVLLQHLRRVDPLIQLRHPRQRALRRLVHGFLRDPVGQAVDRLVLRYLMRLFHRQHVIGVDHLRQAVKQLQLARDHAARSLRQLRLQIAAAAMEKDQLELGLRVLHVDTIGAALVSRGPVAANGHLNRHRCGQVHTANSLAPAAVDHGIR